MGTGKTVTARILAQRTGMKLVDMDTQIEERQGCSIPDIFARDGEAGFRQLERELVHELSSQEGLIISTGGGVVLDPSNLEAFRKNGLLVCLTASADTLLDRLRSDTNRPLLSGDKESRIRQLLEQRKPVYDAIEHQIDGDRLGPEQRADAILALYVLESESGSS